MEAWFEAYAEAYTGIRLAKQIAPWVKRRGLEQARDACHWWWTYAKALAAKGGISAGVAGRIALLERAAQMLRAWRLRAKSGDVFRQKLLVLLRIMFYRRI